MAAIDRACKKGYACGETCISKKKVCLKKLGSNRAVAIASAFRKQVRSAVTDPTRPDRSTPDLVSDI